MSTERAYYLGLRAEDCTIVGRWTEWAVTYVDSYGRTVDAIVGDMYEVTQWVGRLGRMG